MQSKLCHYISIRVIAFAVVLLFCTKKNKEFLPIDFFREQISIEISTDQAKVTGEYFFKNLTSEAKKVTFYYPFPVDSVQLYPSFIVIDCPYTKDSTGLQFAMSIGAKAKEDFKITYVQPLKARRFRYITITTREWKRAITEAKFIITAPRDLHLKINYSIAKKIESGNNIVYTIVQESFFPDTDLIITW